MSAIGGIYGLLRRIGLTVNPAELPSDTEVEFVGSVSFDNDVSLQKLPTVKGNQAVLVAEGSLVAVDTAGGVFSWENPWSVPVMILGFVLEVTTGSSGACTVNAGTAANATTSDNALLNGQSVATAGVFSATARIRLNEAGGTKDTVTVSRASGAAAGLVGRAYVMYVPIQ